MKKSEETPDTGDDMLPEYDFRGGIRGNVVVLDPDVAAEFKDSAAVNAALRTLLRNRSEK